MSSSYTISWKAIWDDASEFRRDHPFAGALYNLAGFRSLLSGLATRPVSGLTTSEAMRLGEEAVETLRRTVAAGLQDVAYMRRDTDLDPLRSRPDFQLLLMDLAFPEEPLAR